LKEIKEILAEWASARHEAGELAAQAADGAGPALKQ